MSDTPNGGKKVEVYYFDINGNPIEKAQAKTVKIRELDADGHVIFETVGFVNKK